MASRTKQITLNETQGTFREQYKRIYDYDAREKPIIIMLEEIKVKLMTRWAQNREVVQNYLGTILPRIRLRLEIRSKSAGEWWSCWSTAKKYEMSSIPCAHAISYINFKGLDMKAFVADCYKKEAYLKYYESVYTY
ncbi:hypothetical protein Ahy_A07g031786 [Arachis hypogaea]|uniref:Zinc finger PMZ-type domain-containing protein n=1 Tax=Arachis hypogaea TaxID=3818 RepID=A0A445C4Y9_ARAHY|nr:hypothetical protein Ahy_A07g031786 [Arachis hypogaea]